MARKGKVSRGRRRVLRLDHGQRLAEYDIFDEVVLTDIIEGSRKGSRWT
jgi:hypothetical protein